MKRGSFEGKLWVEREYFLVMEGVASDSSVPELTFFYTGCKENCQSGVK